MLDWVYKGETPDQNPFSRCDHWLQTALRAADITDALLLTVTGLKALPVISPSEVNKFLQDPNNIVIEDHWATKKIKFGLSTSGNNSQTIVATNDRVVIISFLYEWHPIREIALLMNHSGSQRIAKRIPISSTNAVYLAKIPKTNK